MTPNLGVFKSVRVQGLIMNPLEVYPDNTLQICAEDNLHYTVETNGFNSKLL